MSITPSMLLTILDSPIAYHRIYATITGSVTSAVMLSQAMYWTPRTSDPHNWFYKTADDWQEETGLSRREQETARRILKDLQILEEKKHGLPCKLFFRVNLEVLYRLIVGSANQDSTKGENKYGGKRQTAMYSSAIQDVIKETNNLYTEITSENTSENTTKIESRKSFDLHSEEKRKNLALENKSEDQDPAPLNPPAPLSESAIACKEKFENRFSSSFNRFAPRGLEKQGFSEWHLGGKRNNWHQDLIAVSKVHLKKHEKPSGDGDAINFINGICLKEDWAKLELFTDEAKSRIEKSQSQARSPQPQQQPIELIASPPPAHLRERFRAS